MKWLGFFRKLWKNESGQGMVEYGLILALIAIVVIVALSSIGTSLKTKFENINTEITNAGTTGP